MKVIKVTAAILKNEGKYLIAQRASNKTLPGKWEFPGGKIEKGETPEAALKRELLEELGIDCIVQEHLVTVKHAYPDFEIELMAYRVAFVKGEFKLVDHDRIEWLPKSALLELDLADADIPILEKLD